MRIEDDETRWREMDRLDPRWRARYAESYGALPAPHMRFFLRYRFGNSAQVYTQAFDSDMARALAIIGLPIDVHILRKWHA